MTDTLLLVAAGPDRHTPALQRAVDLAQRAEVPIHVCLPVHDALIERSTGLVHPDVRHLAQQQFLDGPRAWLDGLLERWRAAGLRASGEVIWAPVPHEAILGCIVDVKPVMVVKDVGHQPLLKRLLFTALDWKLLRYSTAPLMLVHEMSNHLPRRIAAAVDTALTSGEADALNRRVVHEALKLADWAEADTDVVHVFPYLPPSMVAADFDSVYRAARSADLEAFAAFANDLQVPPPARHWLEGAPVYRLVEFARTQSVDLLVLGAAYHSRLDRLLMGSTAESLLFQLPCDVLLVKHPDFSGVMAELLTTRASRAA